MFLFTLAAMKELEKESETLHQRRTERRNSWSSMMGAMGFAGGESETHAPYKHLEGKHLGHLLGDTAAPVHESAAGAPEQRHASKQLCFLSKQVFLYSLVFFPFDDVPNGSSNFSCEIEESVTDKAMEGNC